MNSQFAGVSSRSWIVIAVTNNNEFEVGDVIIIDKISTITTRDNAVDTRRVFIVCECGFETFFVLFFAFQNGHF